MTADLPAKAVIREWFAVFNHGDVARLERIHATDCRNHAPGPFDLSPWPATGKPFGPDEAGRTIEWIRANQPDLHVEIEVGLFVVPAAPEVTDPGTTLVGYYTRHAQGVRLVAWLGAI